MSQPRYRITLQRHGLNEYELKPIGRVFKARTARDAISKVDEILSRHYNGTTRLTYNAKQFLKAVAISAGADLHDVSIGVLDEV